MLQARTSSPSTSAASSTIMTVRLPEFFRFFLQFVFLRFFAELLRPELLCAAVLLPEERLLPVLRLWALPRWFCLVLWRDVLRAAGFSSAGTRLDATGSFAPQRDKNSSA